MFGEWANKSIDYVHKMISNYLPEWLNQSPAFDIQSLETGRFGCHCVVR